MKRLVILLLIVCPLMASAKTTLRTMLVEGKTWYYAYHHYNDEAGKYDDRTYSVSYTVRGDTVIDGREYRKMYRWDEVSRETLYYGAFREDEDGRVWQYYAGRQKDFMICDITTYYYFEEADVAVEDVIDINGKLLKRYQRRGLIGLEGVGLQNYGIILYPLAPEPDCYCDYETFEYMLDDEFIFYNSFFNLPTYIQLTENEKKLVEQNNDFAFNLFRKIRDGKSKVLSPLSITYALGMLNNGAGGQTQQEINTVLGFDDVAAQNEFCQKITNGLLTAGYTDNTTKAILSNTIFVNKGRGYELQQDFTHTVNNYYYAYPQSRDFNDGETRGVINQWASDHTEGMVQEVLSEQEFDPNAVDYLLNATYFKGMWSRPFEIENTTDKPFAGGEKVPMMGQRIQTTYAENNLYQTVSLPYGNGTYTMQVFLPREGKTLDEVLESLNGKNWQINGNNYEVGLELPRFEIETNQDLVHVMTALGMPSAFNPGTADFSHMCPIITDGNNIGGNIYIDMMKQVAKIKVDEMGSRAAAVTTSGALPTSLPPYASFCANRPFFYIISEQSTGVILFMGQYMGNHPEGKEDPTDEFYRPFVEEGKVWTYHYHGYNGREFNVDRVMDGDTIIGGQTYKKIYDKIGGQYLYALREKGKKVYIVSNEAESLLDETGTESLLYDFSKDVGDVIDELEYPLIVASVDTIDIDGVKFRRMRVQDANQPIEEWNDEMINMYNFWIEGVGSECLLESSIREPGNDYNLLSCQINGRIYTQKELLKEATKPSEDYYYYYRGNKIPLTLNEDKVVVSIPKDDGEIIERLDANIQTLTLIKDETFDIHVVLRSEYEKLTTLNFWTEDAKSVIITLGFYTERNEEVYSTPYLSVKLKKEEDIDLLSSYAEQYGLRIVKNMPSMPLWYILSVTSESEKSPLVCANELYESGNFASSEPDLAFDVFPQMAYRPFVEEGKVWKVGNCQAILDNSVHVVDYYYFDGDTIIDGKVCKKMMRQRFVSPGFSDEYGYWTPQPFLRKVGAWYEEDQKVYFYDETTQSMVIKYDFSLGDYETVDFLYLDGYPPYIIGPKQTGGIEGFKGVYRDIMMGQDININTKTHWLEGVGGLDGPFSSVYHPLADSKPDFLMSCVVGDEVIYLNDRYEDGATPESVDAKKRRFDFNHTVKTQPKTPLRRGEETALYGEYNNQLLDINLKMLNTAYMVRITNQKTGETLYEKAINAGNIVALNIDISEYPEGQYEITIDNSNETFNGVIDTTTGIDEIVNGKSLNSKSIYNLQGLRMKQMQKGLNIVDGKKIFIK